MVLASLSLLVGARGGLRAAGERQTEVFSGRTGPFLWGMKAVVCRLLWELSGTAGRLVEWLYTLAGIAGTVFSGCSGFQLAKR